MHTGRVHCQSLALRHLLRSLGHRNLENLPEIDGFVLDRQSTHRAEDGFSKWRESGTGVLDDLCHVAGSLFVIKCAVDIYANGLR